LSARSDEIRAAGNEAEAARAALEQSQWRLAQKAVTAPANALVFDTLYTQGEFIPAGNPVMSLLPPGNIKLRFFVPETRLGEIKLEQKISVTCDGCAAPISATISYIARQAEYTPPIIYSKESRAKLVYLVEARPAPFDAIKLHPGQPVDVVLK
jgi:HlyD family secretion protein